MFSALLAGALIVAASLVLGAAVMAVSGRPRHSPVAPAAGLATLLVICGIAVKLPGHAVTAAIAVAVALVASFFIFGRSDAPTGRVRIGAFVVVAGAALVAAIPFLVNGRVGILGQGLINDDMASHLLFTEWLDTHAGPTPDLIQDGYPLGPHAIVAAVAKVSGASLIEGFAGLTGAIAVLLALTAYGALPGMREWLRVPAAVLVSTPYLAAAYLSQGAFKEPMLALALLGFALALPALRPAWPGRDRGGPARRGPQMAVPLGVIAAGTIYNYSFPGLAWLLGAAVVWMLAIAWLERDSGGLRLGERLRGAKPALLVGDRPADPARAPGALPPRQLQRVRGDQPPGHRPLGRVRQPAPGAQPARGVRRMAIGRVPHHSRQFEYPGDRLLPRRPAGADRARLGPGPGTRAPRGRASVRARRLGPRLSRRARLRHALHAGEGTGDRGAGDHADRPPRPALGRLHRGRGGSRRAGRLVAAGIRQAPGRLRPTASGGGLHRRGCDLRAAAAAGVGGRARLPPPGDEADAPAGRGRGRPLPRSRQLRLLGADRLRGLRADHQPLRHGGDPGPVPGDLDQRQVRLG